MYLIMLLQRENTSRLVKLCKYACDRRHGSLSNFTTYKKHVNNTLKEAFQDVPRNLNNTFFPLLICNNNKTFNNSRQAFQKSQTTLKTIFFKPLFYRLASPPLSLRGYEEYSQLLASENIFVRVRGTPAMLRSVGQRSGPGFVVLGMLRTGVW